MFKVIIANGQQKMPDDDIYYIVAKEGIFIKKKLGIMDSVSPVKNISILESVQATAKMNIEKIPSILTAKIANFFRAVQEEHKSEAIVLLFYNEKTKKYKAVPPSQKVSAASIEYNRSVVIDGWTMIGDIHSHSSMSAFHSGTDQGDEESFDGLHITFGNINSKLISISASIVSNGNRVIVNPEEYMKGISLDHEVDEVEKVPTTRTYKWINGAMVEQTSKYLATTFKTYRKYDKRYKIISEDSIKAKPPTSWINAVEYKTYISQFTGFGNWQGNYHNGYFDRGKWVPPKYSRGWNENFDSDIWNYNKKTPPQNVGVKVKPITFPKHDQDPTITDITPSTKNPCESCAFKEKAFEYVACCLSEKNNGTIKDKDVWTTYEKEVYECQQCNVVVSFEYDNDGDIEGDIICPSCKSEDNLVLLENYDDDDMPPSYELDDNKIHCKSCGSSFDITMLKKEDCGASCPFCETMILLEDDINYIRKDDKYVCRSCNSEFTSDLIKDDCCPFCQESLILDGPRIRDLLGPDTEEIEKAVEKEIDNFQERNKEPPNPANMIPDSIKGTSKQKMNPLQWMYEKFGRKL